MKMKLFVLLPLLLAIVGCSNPPDTLLPTVASLEQPTSQATTEPTIEPTAMPPILVDVNGHPYFDNTLTNGITVHNFQAQNSADGAYGRYEVQFRAGEMQFWAFIPDIGAPGRVDIRAVDPMQPQDIPANAVQLLSIEVPVNNESANRGVDFPTLFGHMDIENLDTSLTGTMTMTMEADNPDTPEADSTIIFVTVYFNNFPVSNPDDYFEYIDS